MKKNRVPTRHAFGTQRRVTACALSGADVHVYSDRVRRGNHTSNTCLLVVGQNLLLLADDRIVPSLPAAVVLTNALANQQLQNGSMLMPTC